MWFIRRVSLACHFRRFSSVTSTIFALSSGRGKCGVAVIRISGPQASKAILKMTKCKELPKPRMASLHHIRDPETHEELDKGLVLWFPGPRSFTGEDSCEFQVHGGPAVVASVLSGLSKIPGFRPAEAGDFTKRAFFAGKLDLTEVEGLGDLIHAETELQRKQALYQLEGNLSKLYKNWREILKRNLAHIEAYIDFSEEENIEDDVLKGAYKALQQLRKEIKTHLTDGRRGERLRDGIKTTIIGEPNAGKSSLLNAISQRPAAIVTPIPGTTRDIIETQINIKGYPIILTDTAGLRRETSDLVEKEGIKRAHASIENSDLILLVIDSQKLCKIKTTFQIFLEDHLKNLQLNVTVEKVLNNCKENNIEAKFLIILNKLDLLDKDQKLAIAKMLQGEIACSCISCKTEEGIHELMSNMTNILEKLCANPSRESPSLTQSRHRFHLTKCLELLNEYFEIVNTDVTLGAQKLRVSLRHLGKVIGTVTTEEILDVIFKDFCIGK